MGPTHRHGASILYRTRPRRLIAIDAIQIHRLEGQSSPSRTIVAEDLLDERPW